MEKNVKEQNTGYEIPRNAEINIYSQLSIIRANGGDGSHG
jgi:hypothetical protein